MNKSKENKSKYLYPPDVNQVGKFISDLKVSYGSFEKFYGIPKGTINQVMAGFRNLPAQFWHIIYEKIEPKFGSGFLQPIAERHVIAIPKTKSMKKYIPQKPITKPITINPETAIGRLGDLLRD